MKWVLRILAVLAGLIVAAVLVLAVLSHRSDAGEMHVTIDIRQSADTLWPWLDQGEKAKLWVSWLVEVRKSGPVHDAVGAKEVWVMKDPNMGDQLMSVEGTCTAYEKPSRLSVRLAADGFTGDQTYLLTPAGNGGTRLTVNAKFVYTEWWAQLMEPLITPSANKKMMEDLARLKAIVEIAP